MDVSKIDLNKLPTDARKDFMKYAIKYDEKVKEQKVHEDFLTVLLLISTGKWIHSSSI